MDKMDSDGSGSVDFEEFESHFSAPKPEPAASQPKREKTDWAAQMAKEEEEAGPGPEPEPVVATPRSARKRLGAGKARGRSPLGGGEMGTSGMKASRNLGID